MTTMQLEDAFAHHSWASETLIDACAGLTAEQLAAPVPGTYGSIMDTLRHMVGSDSRYLDRFRPEVPTADEEKGASLPELSAIIKRNGPVWIEVLAAETDLDRDIVEPDDGLVVHSPVGVRLAQVIHHGTDHRSQVCTALTGLGIEPPDIDVWAYAQASGRQWLEPV